jgi:hypothetical protein
MKQYCIKPDSRFRLKDFDPDDTGEYRRNDQDKARARAATEKLTARLGELQEHLYAHGGKSLLIVLQGMDTRVSTHRAAKSSRSKLRLRRTLPMTFCGASTAKCPPRATSASSTGRTTRTC